jgi:hypothetical protein
VELPIFGLRGDFYHLDFQRVTSSERQDMHWVVGFWSAFHWISLKLTPDPITPWLLFAVVYGEAGLPTDINYIRSLDPISAAILEPWFGFHAQDILPDGLDGSLQQILMTYLEIHEVSSILCLLFPITSDQLAFRRRNSSALFVVLDPRMITMQSHGNSLHRCFWGIQSLGRIQTSKLSRTDSIYPSVTPHFSRCVLLRLL